MATEHSKSTIDVFDPTNGHILDESPGLRRYETMIAVDNSGGSGAPGEGKQGRYYVFNSNLSELSRLRT